MNIPNILAIVGAAIYVATSVIGLIRQWNENKQLKIKLRRALLDCRAFYEIEARLCETLAMTEFDSTLFSVQRRVRAAIRSDGMLSPSSDATPRRIAEELAKLS